MKRKRLTAMFTLACIAIGMNAQILWKISGHGLDKPSYLFGTHHLAPYHILDSIKGWEAAFDATTQMVGEIKMSEMQSPEAMQLLQQNMMMTDGKSTKDFFTPEEYEMINRFVIENLKFDLKQMPALKPVFVSNNVTVLLYMKHVPDYKPQEQLDTYFQAKAAEQKKTVNALESMAFQVDFLFNSSTPERQAELLLCALNDIDKTIEKAIELSDAYMRQDLDAILKMVERKEGTPCDLLPGELAALSDDRNVKWMKKIPAMMQEQPTFFAVGAFHLVGKKGLLNLLTEAGYTIEAVD